MKIVNHLFNLSNRSVIIAGGAGQIGFSFAEILADAGANVFIADLDTEMAREKAGKINDDSIKDKIKICRIDVSSEEDVKKVFKEIYEEAGNIYGVINSFHFKGNSRKLDTSSNFFANFENYPLEAWEKVHDINLKGTFLMCREAVPYFKMNGGGVIVNVSSTYGNISANKNIYGNSGINSPASYASSKSAIINFTRYLATHLSDYNIRANVLSPGGVFNNQSEEFLRNYTSLTPLKRMARPEDYQGAILYLISDASKYMTGANLIVDGGWTAW
jgi:NAD(P)-dependent dehydrogenase (short-subunit alcohol dehydrogenase family)